MLEDSTELMSIKGSMGHSTTRIFRNEGIVRRVLVFKHSQ